MVKKTPRVISYLKYNPQYTIISDLDSDNKLYICRQNAILKQDASYLTFLNNSIFIACNMFEEIIINNKNIVRDKNIMDKTEQFISEYGPGWQ